MPSYAHNFGSTRQRVVGVALGLLWLTLRDRHAGARGQRPCYRVPARRGRDRLVGPAPGRDQISVRQCGLRVDGAQMRRNARREALPCSPGRLGRVPRRRNVPGGQGRYANAW